MSEKEFTIEALRHSTAHIMAAAVVKLFPGTKVAIGPAIEDGFYYDFDRSEPFTSEDLAKIEEMMTSLIKKNAPFVRSEKTKSEALKYFSENGEKYKIELINELKDENVIFYACGDFVDLCRGPHVDNTSRIKFFKLLSVAGAYWRGDEKREQLQRIYGTVFFSQDDLKKHLEKIEEAKKRDHRKLGKELEIFSIHEEVGGGLVHWHPKGAIIKTLIENYWRELHLENGYQLVSTPHIASEEIYKISGHIENYSELMYASMDIEGRPYRVKPMNCPGHIMIYKSKLHSYRDLPVRLAELGTVYRFEKSGVLHGLLRVRGFSIDDAHIVAAPSNVKDEVSKAFNFALAFLKAFGFNEFEIYLATRPRDKFVGSDENWAIAEDAIKKALENNSINYQVDVGGGAFYGPKIDVKVKDCLNRSWQCSTIQFDFNLPERFDITYIESDGKKSRPIMIHRALMGSVERFIGVLIEHYAGKFPLWLSPVQVAVLNISNQQEEYANIVAGILRTKKLRVITDLRNEKIGYKIREATLEKAAYILVVGEKEKESLTVAVRSRSGENLGVMKIESFIDKISPELSPPSIKL